MKAKIVLQVVAVIGFLVLSVTVAQAGGGPGVTLLNGWFECQAISGSAPVGDVISIRDVDDFSAVIRATVRVGSAVLACRQVQVADPSNATAALQPSLGDRLKCYTSAVQGSKGNADFLTFVDAFGMQENLRVFAPQFLCTSAQATQ